MKSIKLLIAFIVTGALLASCSITLPVAASSNPVGSKRGQSTGTCYLGVLCFDVDASIQTAAKNAGITKISTVDLKTTNVLNIIVTYTTVVTGE
jgi:hypothetical protein